MSKYDKMVALNAERSKEKIEKAKKTIWDMVDKEEKVTIPKLMQKTGLSRGFFYKNNVIRGELDRALECQVGMIDPRRSIINHAMDQQILRLQMVKIHGRAHRLTAVVHIRLRLHQQHARAAERRLSNEGLELHFVNLAATARTVAFQRAKTRIVTGIVVLAARIAQPDD